MASCPAKTASTRSAIIKTSSSAEIKSSSMSSVFDSLEIYSSYSVFLQKVVYPKTRPEASWTHEKKENLITYRKSSKSPLY